jgi:hypothetical protein
MPFVVKVPCGLLLDSISSIEILQNIFVTVASQYALDATLHLLGSTTITHLIFQIADAIKMLL